MKACETCASTLGPIQVYRGNRFCSVRCANQRGRDNGLALGNAARWSGLRLWQHVVALLGDEWWMSLSDLAILHFGNDEPAQMRRICQALVQARRHGVVIESRTLPWPTHERESIRGYRLAPARSEVAA